ncbi:hypothetical protein [Clostridium neonatale]|uniref:hypothetical protein n=1 Tax=Clostridium neonatale TaxID=137838 RepID=UPI00291BAEB1|nr:hypothetical protein [Clostridium neonatale]CAI3605164.1 Conserved hypothetical protein [Clostridium neonatale]
MSATAFQRMRREAVKKEIVNIPEIEKELSKMTVEELKEYAQEKNIDIGKATSQSGILEKIKEVEKLNRM